MQCYTNRHLRDLLGRLSPDAVLWTEMEKATDLLAGEDARRRRLRHEQSSRPVVLQLGGSDPTQLAEVARLARPFGYSELNLNCGCPSIEAGGADFGAALMRRPDETRVLLERLADAAGGTPVSVKCRVGTHERAAADGSVPAASYEPLAEFVHEVTRTGAVEHVAVHARAAILAGLSPTANRRVPPLRPELVHRLAADFPSLRITVNGGIDGMHGLRTAATAAGAAGLDGLMCGRWVLRRPLDLWAVQSEPWVHRSGGAAREAGGAATRADAVRGYARQAAAEVARSEAAVPEALAPLVLVAEQLHDEWRAAEEDEDEDEDEDEEGGGDGDGRGDGLARLDEDELHELVHAVCDGAAAIADRGRGGVEQSARAGGGGGGDAPPFRALDKLFKQRLGTKVRNKLVRNRAEALAT